MPVHYHTGGFPPAELDLAALFPLVGPANAAVARYEGVLAGMPRKLSNALTTLAVKNAKPGRHADGGGLYLLVKDSGARSWVYRASIGGKVRDIGLGPAWGHDAVSLAAARELARDKAREAKAGLVLVSDRRKQALEAKAAAQAAKVSGTTFRDAADAYMTLREDSWRNEKHRAQWKATLET